jgi:aminoglycoside phosphotransferase (APT) family kinase protein
MKLLARGRECDVFEIDERHVLRRSRRGDSMAQEMEVQAHAHSHGYPTPAVVELRDDGREAVIERVGGPTMLQTIVRRPWTAAERGAALGELHRKLDDVPPLPGLRRFGEGDSLLHLDLHPLNVIMSATGPVVIDWANASVGARSLDVGLTWLIVGAAVVPGRALVKAIAGGVRDKLADGFVDSVGRHVAFGRARGGSRVTAARPQPHREGEERGRGVPPPPSSCLTSFAGATTR